MMQRLLLRSAGLLLVLLSTLSPALAQEHRAAIDRALAYARANAAELGVTARDATSLTVSDAYPSRHTGVTHVYLQQAHQGIPVHNAILSTAVRSDGTIAHTSGRLIADLGAKITGTAPGLSPEAAVEAAARHLGIAPTGSLEVLERSGSGVRRTLLSPAGLSRQPIEARLTYQPLKSGEVRLAWQVTIEMVREPHWWQIRLDAATGEVLDQNDLVDHDTWGTPPTAAATGHRTAPPADARSASPPSAGSSALMPDSYRVYPFPFESPQHGASHVIVTNPINDAPAGTYPGNTASWHDTDDDGTANFTDTRGNNVDAYADRNGDNTPDAGSRPSGGASLDFDFTIDLTQDPSTYSAGAVVNLFYWTNIIHDVVYQYGFDEAAGNFQVNNYGRGGAGGDDVRAEAQDASDVAPPDDGNCNANFGTPADGSRPRMQMYLCDNTAPERDGDLDAGVIAHEYGHGISSRLTGGPANDGCLGNDEQMGEGWSDWFLLSLTQTAAHDAVTGRGVGTYLFGEGPNGGGIRARPYSTDFAVNEFTYDRIKATGSSEHALGHVWGTMLWDLNWALIGDLFPEEGGASGGGYVPGFDPDLYSGNGGNNLAQQLIMDGMKLQGCSPGFIEGRDGILAADQILTGGQNERVIWKVFARRGLGWSADQGAGSDDRTDGTEAFDMPPHLNRPPTADAGEDQTIECAAPTGTEVALDGSGSSDPDETNPEPDVLTYTWRIGSDVIATGVSPTVTLPKGVHTVELTVEDEHGETDTDEVQITIEDTTPPVITLLGDNPLVLECAIDEYLEPGATALDVCDGDLTAAITIDDSEVDTATPGTYEVHYSVLDGSSNEGTATRTVEVVDTTPPDLLVHSEPMSLWPPNHKYHPVDLDALDIEAADLCDLTLGPEDVLVAVAESDELEDADDLGDGATIEDIVIVEACRSVEVRAERAMSGNGRVYTLGLAVADASGNVAEAPYEVHVPANAGRGSVAVPDTPALYTVEGCAVVEEPLARGAGAREADTAGAKGAPGTEEMAPAASTAALPTEYVLHQNYPNPFHAVAEIEFGLPESTHVRLVVYDVLGREVAVLVDESLGAGMHRVAFDASGLRSGTYIYRMEAGPAAHVRHMVLMR